MKRALIFAALALSTPVILHAQQPMPELSLTVNGTQELNLYSGWPLIVHATIMNSSRIPNNGTPTQLLISPTAAPWTNAIQFTAIDAAGQAHLWPLNLIGTPADPALMLAPTSYVRFTVQSAPSDVSSFAPGTYQLTAILQVSNSNGWNGVVQSRPVTIRIGPEPSPLTPEQQSRKALLIAEYQTNAGDLNGALSTAEQLMQSQPSNSSAMSSAANLLELLGYPGLAFFQAGQALKAYFQPNPSVYDPPSNLLAMNQRLFTTVTTPSSGLTPTTTTASGAQVTFSPSSQNVSLSASVSTNTGAPVDGGTVTFTVIGLGGSLVSSLNHGNASALFTVPAGAPAGIYLLGVAFSGTGGFAATSDSSRALTINKATPAISWSAPADLTYGSVLGPAQLNAKAGVSGIFSYNPPAGTPLAVGSGQSLSTTFTPSDALDYNSANASVSLNVRPAQLTVTANNAARQYGALDPPFTASFSGFVNGDTPSVLSGTLSCASNASARSSVGTYAINCSGLTSTNYAINYVSGALVISPTALTIAANNASRPYGANNPVFSATVAGLLNSDPISAMFSTAATPAAPVGVYPIVPGPIGSSSVLSNYSVTLVNGALTVAPETTLLKVALAPASIGIGLSATITVTLTASDMAIPIDPTVLAPVTVTSPVPSDILSNNGVCSPLPTTTPGVASCAVTVTSVEPNGRTLKAGFAGSADLSPSVGTADLTVTASVTSQQVCIQSGFLNVRVPAGNYLWFNSVFKVHDVTKQKINLSFFNSSVKFQYKDASGNLVPVTQAMPDAKVVIDPTVTIGSTTFDAANNAWITRLQWDIDDNAFLTGMPWAVPAGGIPGDIEPVTWCGTFASNVANLDIGWRWAAAAYSSFSADGSTLGVKPMDEDGSDPATRRDRSGTPENFKQFVIPGARGKGGRNYTGTYSRSAVIE